VAGRAASLGAWLNLIIRRSAGERMSLLPVSESDRAHEVSRWKPQVAQSNSAGSSSPAIFRSTLEAWRVATR